MPDITNQDRAAIRRIFRKIENGIKPALDAREKELGGFGHPDVPKVMVAQNTLRTCLEVVLDECLPYDDFLCGELAVRLACYAISVVPIERHARLLKAVQEALPVALAEKLRLGAVIRSEWETNGVSHPNIPAKGDIQ